MVLKSRWNRVQLALLLLPGLAVVGMFTVYPIFRLLWMSFCDWSFASMLDQPFIGLANYREVLGDGTFWTVSYTHLTLPTILRV